MRLITLFLLLSLSTNAQIVDNPGELNQSTDGDVSLFWIKGAYSNYFGSYSEKWQQFTFFCEGSPAQTFRVDYGDTLKILIGKQPVYLAASTRYRVGNRVYSSPHENVCVTGPADVNCFEEFIEPEPHVNSFEIENGCVFSEGLVIHYPAMDYFNITVSTNPCLSSGTCFYVFYPDGTSSEIICF